jgi:nucleotide-binding universal stress UspA family protein
VTPPEPILPFTQSIFHPTDFSDTSDNAFAHALAIALFREASLTIFHAGDRVADNPLWTAFPPVRRTLERWGLLEEGSPRSALFDQLSVRVRKVRSPKRNPLRACLEYLVENPADLLVLATEGREGMPRWMRRSLAEELAQRAQANTLFVPKAARGFVSLETGDIGLRRILLPVDGSPDPRAAIVLATRVARALAEKSAAITLLQVGEGALLDQLRLPEHESWSWDRQLRSGEVADEILAVADALSPDLIVMTTSGRDGVLDALRGSTTEQVLRRAPCPVLAVQERWGG